MFLIASAANGISEEVGLKMLSQIQLPHTFTPAEERVMNQQLDTLRLGIDIFLSMLTNMTDVDKQRSFNQMWPGVRCIFAADFQPSKTKKKQSPQQPSKPSYPYPSSPQKTPENTTPSSDQQQQQQQQQSPQKNESEPTSTARPQ